MPIPPPLLRRHLHIPLVCAERAWAYAMELKNQLEQKPEPRKRQHLIPRLAKAASHAQDLLRLAGDRCDARSSLEADAYAALMGGNVLLERESDWEGALARFLRARCAPPGGAFAAVAAVAVMLYRAAVAWGGWGAKRAPVATPDWCCGVFKGPLGDKVISKVARLRYVA